MDIMMRYNHSSCDFDCCFWCDLMWEMTDFNAKSCPNGPSSLTLVFNVNGLCCWSGSDLFWKNSTWASKWGWFQLPGLNIDETAKEMVGADFNAKSCQNGPSSLTLVFNMNGGCCWSCSDLLWKNLTWASKWGWFQLLGLNIDETAKEMVGVVRGLWKRSGGDTEGRNSSRRINMVVWKRDNGWMIWLMNDDWVLDACGCWSVQLGREKDSSFLTPHWNWY
jgi:hypothetical protein